MDANEFQRQAKLTAAPGTDIINVALGLAGEAGEVADLVKKYLYHDHPLDKARIAEELGDAQWYIAMGCEVLDIDLSLVMGHTIQKLKERYPDGFSSEASMNRT